jgi:dipeptidyl aminopeptidase/acylaminoacyl peptidase
MHLIRHTIRISLVIFSSALFWGGPRSWAEEKKVPQKYLPPEIPRSVRLKIQNYLDVRAPGFTVLQSKAKSSYSAYFQWRVTGTRQIWALDRATGFPVQFTGGEEPTSLVDLTPDGDWLIVQRDQGGDENPGLFRMSSEGGPLIPIQVTTGKQVLYELTSPDSRFVYFRSNSLQDDSYALFRYDLQKDKVETLFTEAGKWTIADLKDQKLLLAKRTGALTSEIFVYDLKSKKLTALNLSEKPMEFRVQFGQSAEHILVLTPKDGEFRRLFVYEKKRWRAISPPLKSDVEDFALDSRKKTLIYTLNDGGFSKLRAFRYPSMLPIDLGLPKDVINASLSWISPRGQALTLSLERAQRAPEIAVFEPNKKGLKWLLKSSSPELDFKRFADAQLEYYPAHDGTQIPMLVRRPQQCPPGKESLCPVIFSFHGGPEGQSRPGFNLFAQIFVDHGFVFVEPNVRGSDGFGQTWLNADNGVKRLAVISDVADAGLFARRQWGAKKIGVMGGSYGGYATLMAMTKFSGTFDAGVAIVGMSNLVTFLQNTAPYRRTLRESEYGDPTRDREALLELSPMTHVDKIQSPLLLIQGANDPRVPASEAMQMIEVMEKKNIPGQLILFPDEGHGVGKRANQLTQTAAALQFFQTHLLQP